VHMLHKYKEELKPSPSKEDRACLVIGTMDFEADTNTVKQYKFLDIDDHQKLLESGMSDNSLHKKLTSSLFSHLGYPDYNELDVNSRCEINWDLNLEIPKKYHNKYDLIYDGGSVEHVMNSFEALKSILKMTKVGGKIIHSTTVGDCLNHGFWTLNPVLLKEFYTQNGCVLINIFLMDLNGTEHQLKRFNPDHLGVNGHISLKASLINSLQILRHALLGNAEFGNSTVEKPVYWKKWLLKILGTFYGNVIYEYPNWSLIAFFEKTESINVYNTPIQPTYEGDLVKQ